MPLSFPTAGIFIFLNLPDLRASLHSRYNILLFVDDPHLAMLRLPTSRVVPVLNTFIS